MKRLMIDSISRGGYFNFRNIDLKLFIHRQKDPEKMKDVVGELTLFSRVSVYTYCQRDFHSVVRGLCCFFSSKGW